MRALTAIKSTPVVERKQRHLFAGVVAISFALWVSRMYADNVEQLGAVMALSGALVTGSHLVWRICLLVEELFHANRICSGSHLHVFKRSMSFNAPSLTIMILVLALVLSELVAQKTTTVAEIFHKVGLVPFCTSVFAFNILFYISRAEECPVWEDHAMRQMNGLDYGSGMAHSYFYGYLKLILPGEGGKSIRERIALFMEKQGIPQNHFPVQKLIILIPRSGYSYPTLQREPSQDAVDPDIEPYEALEDHLRSRAGTQERVYRGGAYRIRVRSGDNTAVLYTIAEGATPLLTLREAYTSGSSEAGHIRQHKEDIISNFYRTLQDLIKDNPDCKDLVELIYYNDEDASSQANVVSLLGEFLLDHCQPSPF